MKAKLKSYHVDYLIRVLDMSEPPVKDSSIRLETLRKLRQVRANGSQTPHPDGCENCGHFAGRHPVVQCREFRATNGAGAVL